MEKITKNSLKISAEVDKVRQHLSDVRKLGQDKEQQAENGKEEEGELVARAREDVDEGASYAAAA